MYDRPAKLTAIEAKSAAQRLAFAPVAFQAAVSLVRLGILDRVAAAGDAGLTVDEISAQLRLSRYGVGVLLDMGLAIGAVWRRDDRYIIDKVGQFLIDDELTRVNLDFVHDVCYEAMAHLKDSIEQERPVGLEVFGNWPSIYPALQALPEAARRSWHAFDHYYSTAAFPAALQKVLAQHPRHILDVGGNTGKWALFCVANDPEVCVTILDLPEQLEVARGNILAHGMADRISLQAMDILDPATRLPQGADVIWMSQFLDCFSEEQIRSILQRTAAIMSPDAVLFIMELLWDRQRHEAAAYSLHATSLYFTCLANGNSRMYESMRMRTLVEEAGLKIAEEIDDLGVGHTLLCCKRPESAGGPI